MRKKNRNKQLYAKEKSNQKIDVRSQRGCDQRETAIEMQRNAKKNNKIGRERTAAKSKNSVMRDTNRARLYFSFNFILNYMKSKDRRKIDARYNPKVEGYNYEPDSRVTAQRGNYLLVKAQHNISKYPPCNDVGLTLQ